MVGATSAGILLYRGDATSGRQVFIAHMGGPFWARKDAAAWSIPKGEYAPPEDPFAVARREFEEEIGVPAPTLDYALLGTFHQASGKAVTVFAAPFDGDLEWISSNPVTMEWPRGSTRMLTFPEVDRAEWVPIDQARVKLIAGQRAALDALEALP
ncbi:MAG: hypothetical protein RI885_195 [Actinomycetota bacterium]|jgi:predicted NUDIX family NTP pyrophosphohydrolase